MENETMRRLDFLASGVIGSVSRSQSHDITDLARELVSQRRNPRAYRGEEDDDAQILSPNQFSELLGRRQDLVGEFDMDEYDEDDDDDAGYIGVTDIIGAMHAASMGAKLTHKQRKAIRKAKSAMKKAARHGNDGGELALAMRQAGKPIVLTDEDQVLRKLNMPLSQVSLAANSTGSFAVVVQETMRLERLFLYPVGGNYDNLWVGDIFCGRQTNSVVPGNEEPMINYESRAVDSGIEGFTVNYGLTLRIGLRNGTGAPVVIGGKIKGRTLT